MKKSILDVASSVRPTSKKALLPDGRRLAEGLIRQGYAFEQAVADVIDNSIDEDASQVLIRLMLKPKRGYDVLIADDGGGMSASQLEEGMRIGSRMRKDSSKLGKFGLGLKQASLSQCQRLIVASKGKGYAAPAACGWDNDGLKSSMADIWSSKEAARFLDPSFCGLDLKSHGTVVYWQDVDKEVSAETVQKIRRDLKTYLGIHFHRIIRKHVRILIDMPTIGGKATGLPPERVQPIDPFNYRTSGCLGFPKEYIVRHPGYPRLRLRAHVFPHKKDQDKSESESYRLYEGANNSSGFYVYRNDRLLVAGDWFGRLKQEAHTSLARIEMDLPPKLDDHVRLNVQKVGVQFPRDFLDTVWASKSGRTDFASYIKAADKAYRSRTGKQKLKDYPMVPFSGFPNALRRRYIKVIGAKRGRFRQIGFKWDHLASGELFNVDATSKTVILNEKYRPAFRRGKKNGKSDATLLKMLLFFLTEDYLDSDRVRAQQIERVKQLNRSLVPCVKIESGV